MKRKNVPEARLVERSQPHSEVQQPQSIEIAPILRMNAIAISNEITSKEMQIRKLAFQFYEQHGRRHGHDLEDWLEAEAAILAQPKQAA